jgi:hypothetical protein
MWISRRRRPIESVAARLFGHKGPSAIAQSPACASRANIMSTHMRDSGVCGYDFDPVSSMMRCFIDSNSA